VFFFFFQKFFFLFFFIFHIFLKLKMNFFFKLEANKSIV